MSERRLTVLGSASQFPTRTRNHNGHFLRWDTEGILFDPGEGTQRQMHRFGVTANQITRIVLSHFHGDHCLGLPGVIQRLSADKVPHAVTVHYPVSGQEFFERLRYASSFYETATLIPSPITESGVIHENAAMTIRAEKLDHSVDCYGFRIQEKARRKFDQAKLAAEGILGPAVGKLAKDGEIDIDGRRLSIEEVSELQPGQVFAMVTDTAYCEAAIGLAQDADVLLAEATYLMDADRVAGVKHMTVEETAKIAREGSARNLLLTHFSGRYENVQAFIDRAREICPKADIRAVEDGSTYQLARDGRITEGFADSNNG